MDTVASLRVAITGFRAAPFGKRAAAGSPVFVPDSRYEFAV
jgi:hypothetical protein